MEEDQRVTGYLDGRVTLRANVAGQKIKGVVKEAGWQRVHPGDFAISGMNAHLGGMGVSDSLGKCSPIYLVLIPKPDTNAAFVSNAVRHMAHSNALKVLVNTIRFNSADFKRDDLKHIWVQCPPPDEQEATVRFIGALNAKVNRFIRNRRRLIEVLNEQKQAIINRAVTRGLDPQIPFKPTGIDWLGQIPTHWEVVQLRRRWRVTDCKHLTVPFTEEGVPIASVREVQSFDLNLDTCNRTSRDWYTELINGDRAPRCGDLIYCRNVSVGACACVNSNDDLAMGQDVCLIRSHRENQRFLNYFLHSGVMKRQLAKVLVGSTFNRINVSEVKSLIVAVPPKNEQDVIAARLDAELEAFRRPIEDAEREINLIREYRTRLIADVVTGKVDVRGLAPTDEAITETEPEVLDAGIDEETPEDDGEMTETAAAE